jgi:integrase
MFLENVMVRRSSPNQQGNIPMNANVDPATTYPHARYEAPPLTIADAARVLETWTDLSPRRASKMRSALATAARILAPDAHAQSAAAAVAIECASLSRLLRKPPATFGMSASRRTSLCSELRYILRRLGRHEPDRRGKDLASPALQACLDCLSPYRRLAIVDFLRFLESEQITPDAVDPGTLGAYETRCSERTLCRDPAARGRQVASIWNWAHQNVPSWPGKRLARTGRADRYTLPFESYPTLFQQDLAHYTNRLNGRDIDHIFSEDVLAETARHPRRSTRPLRPTSIHMRRWMLRCAAAALVRKGHDQRQLTGLRDLVDPLDHAKSIIRFFIERNGGQPGHMVDRIAQTLHRLARDYCNLPNEHVAAIGEWAKRVKRPEQTGMTEKNARRVRALMQPRVRAMLLWFPMELMRRASSPTLNAKAAARLAMYATAMEILLICPMRRGNLAGLRIDRHLHRPDPRRSKITHIFLSAEEVKNDQAIQWPIPPESGRLIETYLTRYRHHLVDPDNPWLFGKGHKQRLGAQTGQWLSDAITREIGVEFNIHLARHFAAWNFLRQNPGQYEVVRQVLGHRDINVTIAHYVGLEADSAAAHFDTTVLRDRQSGRKMATHAFRAGTGGLSKARRRDGK